MKKVLINHFSPMPNKITGISVYTFNMVKALRTHGSNEYIFSTNWDIDKLPDDIRSLDMKFIHRDMPRNKTLAVIKNTFELPKLARENGCGAIFHPQPSAMVGNLGTSVIVVHDLYRVTNAHLFNWKQRFQWQQSAARGIRGARHVIAVSNATLQATVAAYPETKSRISVVHEASPISRPTMPTVGPTFDQPFALMVANVTPNKNITLLIDALKELSKRGEKPRVYLIGRDEQGVLPGLLAGTDINFVHVGTASDEQLQHYYAHARAYVNTSLVEGFCLPLLEAHTFGLPVICSDLPVLREVAGDGAMFVKTDDAAGLADALHTLFTDDEMWKRLSENAERNNQRFSWKKAALEAEAILNRVAEGRS